MFITRRASIRLVLAGVTLIATGRFALAGKVNADANGIAIEGYDPVAYFTEGQPVEGSGGFTATHDGATYRFASAANRDAFIADPVKYAPQYGGFCAYAVAHDATAPIDPQAFTVLDGKLYLNYSDHVRAQWRNDAAGFISRANENWPGLSGQ
ncbi:MAG: hypothetical protein CL534_18835 [Ahrensia sp.]|nr:hypothetical protein [Ahrensia sp.]